MLYVYQSYTGPEIFQMLGINFETFMKDHNIDEDQCDDEDLRFQYCDVVVYKNSNELHIERIYYDNQFWKSKNGHDLLQKQYLNGFLPELITPKNKPHLSKNLIRRYSIQNGLIGKDFKEDGPKKEYDVDEDGNLCIAYSERNKD